MTDKQIDNLNKKNWKRADKIAMKYKDYLCSDDLEDLASDIFLALSNN